MAKTAQDLVSSAKERINEISVEQALNLIAQGACVLDVREADEFHAGHIDDAHHIPRGLLEFLIAPHAHFQNKDKPVVIYCKTGGRSALAASVMQDLGFSEVYSLQGGFDNWCQTDKN